jgi:hypothetical protein
MGALNPLFLLAGVAVAVPIFLHLFHRHQTRRLSFPALRYLERTEKEHARRIRLRQLLLLMARVVALLLVVGAGARLVFLGRGAAHPPTAVVIVLDNSMSSGLVIGETSVLDELKELALATIDAASDEDRFWIIRAGEPWLPAIPGGPAEARTAVEATSASSAAGDLTAALDRAVGLLATAEPPAKEIHLLSDMQRSAFSIPGEAPAGNVPVVAWTANGLRSDNRALTGIVVGGGLPPLEGQRTEVTVRALGGADSIRVPVRVVVNDRIRGAATLRAGSEASIALPPAGSGWIQGYADADPDDLRADDRRYFAYRSRPAPSVSIDGGPGVFVDQAIFVLREAGRVRFVAPQDADLLITHSGSGLEQRGPETALLVVPAADPTLLPALNRRLADAGIPWRYEPATAFGESEISGTAIPAPFEGVTVRERFTMERVGEPGTPTRTLAEVAGEPWAVEGTSADGHRYLVIASPLETAATSLPTSTGMLRFVDWAASEWAGAGGVPAEMTTGTHLPAPATATRVRFPSGSEVEIDGTRTVRGTGEAGLYTFLAADSTVAIVALNPPAGESMLESLDPTAYPTAIGAEVVDVDDRAAWPRAVYRARQGPELWWPFLLAVLALLLIESIMATSGGRDRRSGRRPVTGPTTQARVAH